MSRGNNMAWIMLTNIIISVCWIAATVYLITTDHTGWAVATFIAALADYFKLRGNK